MSSCSCGDALCLCALHQDKLIGAPCAQNAVPCIDAGGLLRPREAS